MATMKVNPTRMELTRLKGRLKTAVRGHKLLKDKSDEMIRQFILIIKENRALREEVEKELGVVLNGFMLARSVTDEANLLEAISMPGQDISVVTSNKNIMSVEVPKIDLEEVNQSSLFPYSFLSVTSELDSSVSSINKLLPKLIKLAETEKTCNMLANEIEKNRRRVNALEYVMIPQIQETIKYISMKLDETERSNTIRLMKVKSMMAEKES